MTGIELSATQCVVVETDPTGRKARGAAGDVRVRSFTVIPCGSSTPERVATELRSLLDRQAVSRDCWVALWGVRSSHRLIVLPAAKRPHLEGRARHEAFRTGISAQFLGGETTVRTAVGGSRPLADRGVHRDVCVVAASSPDIRARLAPIVDAGFAVRGVVTPSLALGSIAKRRRASVPGSAGAYLAIGPLAMALAIVRDGLVVLSREIAWGFQGERDRPYESPLPVETLADNLASELRRSFLLFKQGSKQNVSELLLCGALPELRELTAPLIRSLDIEVETLDSTEGIDTRVLPEPAERFREKMAELRLACVVSADPAPSLNLLPAAHRPRARLQRRSLLWGGLAAAAAAIFLFAVIRDGRQTRRVQGPAPAAGQQRSDRRIQTPPAPPERAGAVLEQPRTASAIPETAPVPERAPVAPAVPQGITEVAADTSTAAAAAPAQVTNAPVPPERSVAERPEAGRTRVVRAASTPTTRAEAQLVVRSILFSAERRVALVDGRMVREGDQLGDGFIAEISRDSVTVETASGARQTLSLARPETRATER